MAKKKLKKRLEIRVIKNNSLSKEELWEKWLQFLKTSKEIRKTNKKGQK